MKESLLSNLTYFSQVSLFAGIALLIFSRVEKRILLEKIGHLLFVALGLMAVWVILSGQIVVPEMIDGGVPREGKLMFFLFGLLISGVLGVVAFLMRMFKVSHIGWLNVLIVLSAIVLFFMIYDLQRA